MPNKKSFSTSGSDVNLFLFKMNSITLDLIDGLKKFDLSISNLKVRYIFVRFIYSNLHYWFSSNHNGNKTLCGAYVHMSNYALSQKRSNKIYLFSFQNIKISPPNLEISWFNNGMQMIMPLIQIFLKKYNSILTNILYLVKKLQLALVSSMVIWFDRTWMVW